MKPTGTFAGIDYNERKQKEGTATKVYFANFGYLQNRSEISKDQFKSYLENYSARNQRAKNRQFHAALSCKGKEYTHEQLKDVALQMMDRLGYGSNPILMYEHHDTANNHIHIVTSRIAPDGRTVDDTFEYKRANAILNELLQLNPKEAFRLDLDNALSYQTATIPQLLLLMEKKGYDHKTSDSDELVFYKHGKEQGRIDRNTVLSKQAQVSYNPARIRKIQALIYKYRSQYDTTLTKDKTPHYSTSKAKFHSELTDYLHKSFGLEFVFHGKEPNPYGYTIIDNEAKAVYKGSEVFKLQELINKPVNEITETQKLPDKATKGDATPHAAKHSHGLSMDFSDMEDAIDTTMMQVEQESRQVPPLKRKRKRDMY